MYSDAERCVDQGIELCLQVRNRVRWSIYTLAAMFTAHQIYLCNHSDQKAAAMLEMFKEASQNSGWARLCLQNISAYMSGYPMAPFFDKIIIADIMTDFGIAVPVQTNTDYYSSSSSPDSSSGNNSSLNNSVPEQLNQYLPPDPIPAQPQQQYVQHPQHYNTTNSNHQPPLYNQNFNATYPINANNNTSNNTADQHNVMYIPPPQPGYPQYNHHAHHHVNNPNHGSHYS